MWFCLSRTDLDEFVTRRTHESMAELADMLFCSKLAPRESSRDPRRASDYALHTSVAAKLNYSKSKLLLIADVSISF